MNPTNRIKGFRISVMIVLLMIIYSCKTPSPMNKQEAPFLWENATVYFMMTDRFNDGDAANNFQHTSDNPPAPYRGYMGGDLKGITHKIKEGYFTDLGVDAIWFTPVVEQIQSSVNEGTGNSFGFHGYWTRDWTALDPKFGTEEDLSELVQVAHDHKIRVLIDVVANHTGPVTDIDTQWPEEWVKTGPRCIYQDSESTINCTLVDNLPDIRTENTTAVSLPPFLIEKWKEEGRYEEEVAELDAWFQETGYKRTAVNYILKWLVDFIKKFGVDGFRVDTVKHTEDFVWRDLWKAALKAHEDYKKEFPDKIIDDTEFYMVGEVYNYYISGGRDYNYGDRKVDFYKDGFKSLINFDFKGDAHIDYESIFIKYDTLLHGPLEGKSVLNYISSHDDGAPFDVERKRAIEAGTKLLLTPGGVQIYYGDESARALNVKAEGDAKLRSFMNWDEIENNATKGTYRVREVLTHWQKLGKFRRDNPAVGAGRHQRISEVPYIFSRKLIKENYTNEVVVGLDLPEGLKTIDVSSVFQNGTKLRDNYSGVEIEVKNGKALIENEESIVLLSK